MNIDDLTIAQAREIAAMVSPTPSAPVTDTMIGAYVIARCCDAGVHAGVLAWWKGRECELTEARRLWYWKPADGAKFLSGVAVHGLDDSSKVGEPINVILTENCEIIRCSPAAAVSIRGIKSNG